jgi:L-cysteate sulfo-lyase
MVGARLFGLEQELTAVCIDKAADEGLDFADRVLALANETAALVGLVGSAGSFSAENLVLRREFTGGGYGVVGELERRAIGLLARTEGILVDPVYTGRALGALIAMVESGDIGQDECLVFWHTGGMPALFAYEREILAHR